MATQTTDQVNVQTVMSVLDNLSTPLSQMSRSLKQFHEELDRGSRQTNTRFNDMARQAFQAGQTIRSTINAALTATNTAAGVVVAGIAAMGYMAVQQARHFRDLEFMSKETGVSIRLLKEFENRADTIGLRGGITALETMSQRFVDLGRNSHEEIAFWNTYFPQIADKILDLAHKFEQTKDPKYMIQAMELYFNTLKDLSPTVQRIATQHLNLTTQSLALLDTWKEALKIYKEKGELSKQDIKNLEDTAAASEKVFGAVKHLREAITLRVADSPLADFMNQLATELEDPATFKIEMVPGGFAERFVNFWKKFDVSDRQSWVINVEFIMGKIWDWIKQGAPLPEGENPFAKFGLGRLIPENPFSMGQPAPAHKAIKDGLQGGIEAETPSLADKVGKAIGRVFTRPGWSRDGQIGGGGGSGDLRGGGMGDAFLGDAEGFQREGAGRYALWGASQGGGLGGGGGGYYGGGGGGGSSGVSPRTGRPNLRYGPGQPGHPGQMAMPTDPAIQAALKEVADAHGLTPEAIAGMIQTESEWNPNAKTGSYLGLTQVGPDTLKEMGMAGVDPRSLSPVDQIKLYGKWLDHYHFSEKMKKYGIDFAGMDPAKQAAIIQAFQFGPNAESWMAALGRGETSGRTTPTKQAHALGNTSIDQMTEYYKSLLKGDTSSNYNVSMGPIIGPVTDYNWGRTASGGPRGPSETLSFQVGDRTISTTVNPDAAPAFRGFIQSLIDAGAPIHAIGGYGPRYRPSHHPTGFAMDIDQYGYGKVHDPMSSWMAQNMDVIHKLEEKYRMYGGERFGDRGHFSYVGPAGYNPDVFNDGGKASPNATGAKIDVNVNAPRGTKVNVTPDGSFQTGKIIRMFSPSKMTDASPFLPK